MSSPSETRRFYVQRLLNLYQLVPGTTGNLRRSDRNLAAKLHDQGVSLDMIRGAMILAVARRTFRSKSAPRLPPIASLSYFRPVLEELSTEPPEPGYLDYLRHKLSAVAPDFVAGLDHQLPRPHAHQLS